MSPRTSHPNARRSALALALLVVLALGALSPAAGAQATSDTTAPTAPEGTATVEGDGTTTTPAPEGAEPERDAAVAEDPTEPAEPKPEGSTRIVGGSTAPDGAWPSQVALLKRAEVNTFAAQFCGGTALSRSWILTAAHCVTTAQGTPISASTIDVLTGTQSLTSGGTRIPVVEVRVLPGYEPPPSFHRDVALLRLDGPTTAPPQALVAQGSTVAGGTEAITTGWGTTMAGAGAYPTALQEVRVPMRTDAECALGIPGGQSGYGSDYRASSMVCAGRMGKDSCQGDSGGPLVVDQGGTWTQVGITSWGIGCGGQYPGVYSRVAAFRDWIDEQIRFGPFGEATPFVRQTYLDLFARQPTNTELFYAVAGLNEGGDPAAFVRDLVQGNAYQRRTGGVTRLYSAFFLRNPETAGLAYWWGQVNGGRSLQRIANIMAASSEFQARYGTLTDGEYVDLVYQNVLGRDPDPDGRAFWVGELSSGRRSRGEVMAGFSESSEYRNENKPRVDVIISFFGLVRRVPNAGELSAWQPQENLALDAFLLRSLSYASRF
ncbi:trypsin-like serine protease [Iamia majanohamensis]|uniref:Trypsin-like serine protease n=1 Tax=Iamia majanohamensis TaxID=467976 RepID=A0AAE9Y8L7_9ACTN|nr:trypsin-like serine protease [Iamia majanohamensis]WCO68899.1 trypsin-like serine protease [Iamia majanohamensis]